MRRSFLTLLILSGFTSPVSAIDFGRIPPSEISVYIQDLQTGKVLENHRADTSLQPASTMKLVTTFAALKRLGAEYRWQTLFKSPATVQNGTLNGDIYWVGSGDPVFDQKDLIDMQNQMRYKSIRNISGQLVFDDSIWNSTGSADNFERDAEEAFTTPPSPHMLAYKVIWLTPRQTPDGRIAFDTSPPLPEIPQNINIQPAADDSGSCPSLKRYIRADYRSGSLNISGKLPASCLGESLFINLFDIDEFAARSFINQWRSNNNTIAAGFRHTDTPPQAQTLATHYSPPLSQIVRDMNKHSNNLIARTLLLTLGSQHGHQQTAQNGQKTVHQQLASSGIDTRELVLENGSGLSRSERASARMMGEMLEKAYHAPFKQAFIDSLPIGGIDGTLKHRFRDTSGQLHLKTGTLDNVRSLAGYWLPQNPAAHPLSISIIINSPKATAYLPDLDTLVNQITSQYGQ